MGWFQLDSESVIARTRSAATPPSVPSLAEALLRGTLGFTALSVAGFVPWAVFGRALHQRIGEGGMYAVCALVFIALSGPLLHRLIIGPGSLARFYQLFAATFVLYSIGWIAGWMLLRGHLGSTVGLLLGTVPMGWMLARAFDAQAKQWQVIGALFVLNAAGYFIGGVADAAIGALRESAAPENRRTIAMLAHLSWGLCYGLGFGAGLGLAFHLCQAQTRALLGATATSDHIPS